jgi:hypothetical protein
MALAEARAAAASVEVLAGGALKVVVREIRAVEAARALAVEVMGAAARLCASSVCSPSAEAVLEVGGAAPAR